MYIILKIKKYILLIYNKNYLIDKFVNHFHNIRKYYPTKIYKLVEEK
jgi:hypothetical protein